MHIVILPSWYPRNSEDINGCFFREQAIGLSKSGNQVGVLPFIIEPAENLFRRLRLLFGVVKKSDDCDLTTWRIFYPRMRGYSSLMLPTLAERYFKKYCLKHGQPQLIHIQSAFPAGSLGRLIKKKYGIPYCVTEHSSAYPRKLLTSQALREARNIFLEANLVMSVSSSLAFSIKSECSFERYIEIIPNFLHHTFEKINIPKRKQRKTFRFLNVALLNAIKGQNILIKAFNKQFKGKPVELFIGGDGEEYKKLSTLINNLDLGEQVKLLGTLSRNEVKKQMLQCDSFVLSSLYETFSVVLIEALACGKPVVATKCGGPEEIIIEGFNGTLVSKDSIDSLAAGMRHIYNNFSNYDSIKIQNNCLDRFSQKKVINQLENMYKSILEN